MKTWKVNDKGAIVETEIDPKKKGYKPETSKTKAKDKEGWKD